MGKFSAAPASVLVWKEVAADAAAVEPELGFWAGVPHIQPPQLMYRNAQTPMTIRHTAGNTIFMLDPFR